MTLRIGRDEDLFEDEGISDFREKLQMMRAQLARCRRRTG